MTDELKEKEIEGKGAGRNYENARIEKRKGNKNISKKIITRTREGKKKIDRKNDRCKKRKNVWKGKEVGRERRKHVSKAVRILRNGREINNPNKEDVDKYNFI